MPHHLSLEKLQSQTGEGDSAVAAGITEWLKNTARQWVLVLFSGVGAQLLESF